MAERIQVRSTARDEMIDITAQVGDIVARSGARDGLVHLWSLHTTCAITVNEGYDSDVAYDIIRFMSTLVPKSGRIQNVELAASERFRHAEGNSDSHLKTAFFGPGETLMIENGRLLLGQWQKVFLAEWDGPREREIAVLIQSTHA